jgi:amidohydrolase family protein
VIRHRGRLALLVVGLGLMLLGTPASGQGDLPIFDTHLHYSRDAWDAYPVAVVFGLLDRGGIRRAFVSSSPDEGTVMLYEAAPDRIVPVLRPYRERGELGSWHRDASIPPYLEGRLRRPIYKGIGEFHLYGTEAGSPVVRQVVELARRHKLFLHCHCDAEAIDILAGLAPDLSVLWAHAGMSSGPDVVGPLLARHPRLSVELALRSHDVASGGQLDAAWRALFLQYPDRFMVGTDTWVASRWPQVPDVQDTARAWLRQLPPDVARRIASENAERLAAGKP